MNYPLLLTVPTDPKLASYIIKRNENTVKVLASVEKALVDGKITNPDYKYTKDSLNWVIEKVYQELVSEPYTWGGKYENLPKDEYAVITVFYSPSLYLIPGYLKKIIKSKVNGVAIDTAKKFFTELLPLCEKMEILKGMIVKRSDKPKVDTKAIYLAPMASDTAIGMVQKLLTEITTKSYDSLLAGLVEEYTRYMTVAMHSEMTVDKLYKANPTGQHIFSLIRDWESDYRSPFKVLPNASEIIKKEAIKVANDIRDNFIFKNLKKLASILDAKTDLENVVIVGHTVSLDGLQGTLKFTFKDGAEFLAINSVVWGYSQYSRPFVKFPLRFSSVIKSDGTMMKMPSEEKMNTEFVGK